MKFSEMSTFSPPGPSTFIPTSLSIVPSLTVVHGGVVVTSQCFQ